jgi:hypothetical protein
MGARALFRGAKLARALKATARGDSDGGPAELRPRPSHVCRAPARQRATHHKITLAGRYLFPPARALMLGSWPPLSAQNRCGLGRLVVTIMLTGADVALMPPVSVAMAVSV